MVDKRSDAVLAGDFLAGVDIAFGERDFARRSVFLREQLEGGRDGFAGTAPGCVDCLWISLYFLFFIFLYSFGHSAPRVGAVVERHGGGGRRREAHSR